MGVLVGSPEAPQSGMTALTQLLTGPIASSKFLQLQSLHVQKESKFVTVVDCPSPPQKPLQQIHVN